MPRTWSSICQWSFLLVAVLSQVGSAQNRPPTPNAVQKDEGPTGIVSTPADNPSEQTKSQRINSTAVLGPGDEIDITVYGASDLNQHNRVSPDGNISMPLVGYIRVAGLTSSEAEGAIEEQLRQNNILNNPQVSIFVKEYASSNVSVVGEVTKPGSY